MANFHLPSYSLHELSSQFSQMSEPPNRYRIALVGNSCTGKTAILCRLVHAEFNNLPTIGLDFKSYIYQHDQENITFNILDTPGVHRFKDLIMEPLVLFDGVVLVFDLTNRESFNELTWRLDIIKSRPTPNVSLALAGNKSDLIDSREISRAEAEEFAQQHNMIYLETSAETGENIEILFQRLAQRILQQTHESS